MRKKNDLIVNNIFLVNNHQISEVRKILTYEKDSEDELNFEHVKISKLKRIRLIMEFHGKKCNVSHSSRKGRTIVNDKTSYKSNQLIVMNSEDGRFKYVEGFIVDKESKFLKTHSWYCEKNKHYDPIIKKPERYEYYGVVISKEKTQHIFETIGKKHLSLLSFCEIKKKIGYSSPNKKVQISKYLDYWLNPNFKKRNNVESNNRKK